MNKSILVGAVAVCVVGAVLLYTMRPEPNPQEQLRDAAEQAGDAVRDATEAVGEAAQEATDAAREEMARTSEEISTSLSETAASMMESVTDVSQETADAVTAMIEEWRSSGIVTSEGIDFDAAVAAVDASDMDPAVKTKFTALLEDLRDAPDQAMAKLQELETALSQ